MPGCPKLHNFSATAANPPNNLKVFISSLPRTKAYVIRNAPNDSIFIKAAVFEDPNLFYLMENGENNTKHLIIKIGDSKFYGKGRYKTLGLKIVHSGKEQLINYAIDNN